MLNTMSVMDTAATVITGQGMATTVTVIMATNLTSRKHTPLTNLQPAN